jgi:hypothetical protein
MLDGVHAVQRPFQGVWWQQCHVRLQRHVLGRTPQHLRAHMATGQRIPQADERPTTRTALAALADRVDGQGRPCSYDLRGCPETSI